MSDLEYSPLKGTVYGFHKALGITVLLLALMRVVWTLSTPRPHHLETHAVWEIYLSRVIHILLYIGMIGMPLSGWVMSSAGDHAVPFFGLFNLPAIVPKDEALFRLSKDVHEITGFALVGAIGLHFAGALKHHLIDKDFTLRRMGGNLLIAGAGGLLLLKTVLIIGEGFMAAPVELSPPVQEQAELAKNDVVSVTSAPQWIIDKPASAIGFYFTQYGQPVSGSFGGFDGTIRFDPANLPDSLADIRIQTASISTGDAGRDEQARGAEWFDSATYPDIHFMTKGFTHEGDNRYSAMGTLTIRDVSTDITLPFTLDIDGNRALMKADLVLKRLDFGVGQGEWAAVDAIGGDVTIAINLSADRS